MAETKRTTAELNIVVNVENVLSGAVIEESVTVKTLELSYGGADFSDWRVSGEQVILFLTPSEEESGLYIPANTNYAQTVYSLQDDELDPVMEDPLSEEVATLSLTQFVAQFSPRR